jgi:hypothetical protein
MVAYGTTMRWGNYDTVNAAVRWLSGEVPSGISLYPNPVPATQTLPASFFLNSRPSWWATSHGTPPWPPIGPDVTNGNIPGVAGYANKIPSELCYENLSDDPFYQRTYAVTAGSWSGGFVTLAIGANAAVLNNAIVVSGINPSSYNGTFPISSLTATTVSYRMETTPGTYVSGGAVATPNIKTFNANACYGSSLPAPPTNLSIVIQ